MHESLQQRATRLVAEGIARARSRTYSDLAGRADRGVERVIDSVEGEPDLVLETEAMWDLDPGADVRVMVSVWNPAGGGGTLAVDDFIVAQDGTFVGE